MTRQTVLRSSYLIDGGTEATAEVLTYTAWDSIGRPIAGATPSGAGPLATSITYDDTKRTVTTTVLADDGGVASCDATSYDENGAWVSMGPCGSASDRRVIDTTSIICL
jgi:hypothetical protein